MTHGASNSINLIESLLFKINDLTDRPIVTDEAICLLNLGLYKEEVPDLFLKKLTQVLSILLQSSHSTRLIRTMVYKYYLTCYILYK